VRVWQDRGTGTNTVHTWGQKTHEGYNAHYTTNQPTAKNKQTNNKNQQKNETMKKQNEQKQNSQPTLLNKGV
jgi:hypothetical protein